MRTSREDFRLQVNGVSEEALPAIPGKVNLDDLKSNGKLLADDEIARIRQATAQPAGNETARVSKKALQSEYSVIRNGDEMYAIYKGGEQGLGAGKMGSVKLAQNLDTGKWVALKVQEVNQENLPGLKSEYGRLQQAGQALGESPIIGSKSKKNDAMTGPRETYQILMEYVPGVTLDSMITKGVQISPENRIQIGVNSLTAFSDLNQQGIVHGDIHGGNVLVDQKTMKATPIDFGLSSSLADKQPDEAKRAMRNETVKMANMMVNLYGFALGKIMGQITVVEDAKTAAAQNIPDPVARQKLAEILTELYKPDSLVSKAVADMKKLKLDYSYQPEQAPKVAMVDVNEVKPSNQTLMQTLKQFDQVVLMDNGAKKDERFYASARAALEKQGVPVNDSLFRGDDKNAVAERAMEVTAAKSGVPSSYFHVTATDAKVNNAQVCSIKVDSAKPVQDHTAQVQEHALNMVVSTNDKTKVEDLLNKELDKLQGSRSSAARQGAAAISHFVAEMKADNKMNYNTLASKLETLGQNVGQTGILKHVFNVLEKKTPAQKTVSNIKDAFTTKALSTMRASRRASIPEAVSAQPSHIQEPAPPISIQNDNNSPSVAKKVR